MENLSLNISPGSPSRDLLQLYTGSPGDLSGLKDNETEEVELSLGLSLGGRFGVDRTSLKLTRSSSVATYLPMERNDSLTDVWGSPALPPPATPQAALVRTSSLPVVNEEELRKRKEAKSWRRMESKKRRCEKQRNLMMSETVAGAGAGGSSSVEDKMEVEVGPMGLPPGGLTTVGSQSSSEIWAAMAKGNESSVEIIDLESKAIHGSSGELSLGSIHSITEGSNQEIGSSAVMPAQPSLEGPSGIPRNRGGPEIGVSALVNMPCVFTSQNGRRVDGILYKYGQEKYVKIMCVCHGTFYSARGFVMHAGGPSENPLQHIMVNYSALSGVKDDRGEVCFDQTIYGKQQ